MVPQSRKDDTMAGYPAVPRNKQCMILVRYDLFPHMLVHKAMRLPDGGHRWVSCFEAGHQNLGEWRKGDSGALAVLPVSKGLAVKQELDSLTEKHRVAKSALTAGFTEVRDAMLQQFGIRVSNDGKHVDVAPAVCCPFCLKKHCNC